jgi:hypothetical protein
MCPSLLASAPPLTSYRHHQHINLSDGHRPAFNIQAKLVSIMVMDPDSHVQHHSPQPFRVAVLMLSVIECVLDRRASMLLAASPWMWDCRSFYLSNTERDVQAFFSDILSRAECVTGVEADDELLTLSVEDVLMTMENMVAKVIEWLNSSTSY